MTRKISFLDILRSLAPLRIKLFKILDHSLAGLIACFLFPVPNQELPLENKRILIIRPGGAGDAVFLLPILKVLHHQGFVIDILCEQRNVDIFASQSHLLDKVYIYEKQLPEVFKRSYDVVVDTEQWHYLSAIVSYFIRTECRIGFATRPLRAKLFNIQVPYQENGYELDNFKRLFEGLLGLQIPVNDINDCFDVPGSIKTWALEQIPDRGVGVFLGASIALRRFSVPQLLVVIRDLLANDYCPVLLGGKDVVKVSHQVIKEIKDPKVLDFVGKASLMQSAAIIQRSCRFIGPDSGLMHLACAVGTPVIAVFGPGNLAKWGPKGNGHKIITENVTCSPCTMFGYTLPICGGSYHCMKNIKIDKVSLL